MTIQYLAIIIYFATFSFVDDILMKFLISSSNWKQKEQKESEYKLVLAF